MKKLLNLLKKFNLKKLGLAYLLYGFITGILVFAYPKKISSDYKDLSDKLDFKSKSLGPDRAGIIEDPYESGLVRLKIIQEAEKSLDISYFSMDQGDTTHIFFGALFDAAERGVQVNLLLDGMFNGVGDGFRYIKNEFYYHPNLNLKFYQPPNPLKPWSFNNRMHDKYIIADEKLVLIGGRNIGDKYFAPKWYKDPVTRDRDVLIYGQSDSSVVNDISSYFEQVWSSKFSKKVLPRVLPIGKNVRKLKSNLVKKEFETLKKKNKDFFANKLDLKEITRETNKISFIHNPIEAFTKEPWVLYELLKLIDQSEEEVFLQSPYVLPRRQILKDLIDINLLKEKNIKILTNSIYSSPNIPGFAGYLKYRPGLVSHTDLYEIQSSDSIHAKAFLIDGEILGIGSFNLDPRSFNLSTESMVVIHSQDLISDFKGLVENDLELSKKIDNPTRLYYKKPPRLKIFIIRLASLILYPLDFLI